MTKADFFAQFQRVTDRTWTEKLCRSAFRKTGLIPLDPEVVYEAIRKKGYHFQEEILALAPEESLSDESEPAFTTPSARPILCHEFDTPITNTTRKRGIKYLNNRDDQAVTPTARRVRQKCDKAADTMVLKGQLAQELLMARKAEAVQKERNKPGGNKVVQNTERYMGSRRAGRLLWIFMLKNRLLICTIGAYASHLGIDGSSWQGNGGFIIVIYVLREIPYIV
jgi:hypothetical protein